MGIKEKNMYKFSFIISYYAVLLFLLEEYIRLNEINLALVTVFSFQNIALFLSMLVFNNKNGD